MNRDELQTKVGTIVIVLMENRSFDHLFGSLRLPAYGNRPDVLGLTGLTNLRYANNSPSNQPVYPFIGNDSPFIGDLPHNRTSVAEQLAVDETGTPTMTGFVNAYLKSAHTSGLVRPPPMSVLPPSAAPMSAFFAEHYTLCDQWFAPIPTSTFPNRLMAMCGDALADETKSSIITDQRTVYHYLTDLGVRWRVYHQGLPFLLLMPGVWPFLADDQRFRRFSRLADDARDEPDATWPQVIFIEPDYFDSPIRLSGQPCDNHPPLPMAYGEAFLHDAYTALSASPRWKNTVMVYTYDEHGGFFDHFRPLKVRQEAPSGQYPAFETTGPRVPAVVISPMADAKVRHEPLDHTSLLQLLAERFGDPKQPITASVAARREAGIRSVSALLDASLSRTDVPPPPAIPAPAQNMQPTFQPMPVPLQVLFANAAQGLAEGAGWVETVFPEISSWLKNKGQ